MLVADKLHYNNPVNLSRVSGIFVPDNPSRTNEKYYIRFILPDDTDIFWFYESREQRDYIYNNLIFPKFVKLLAE